MLGSDQTVECWEEGLAGGRKSEILKLKVYTSTFSMRVSKVVLGLLMGVFLIGCWLR